MRFFISTTILLLLPVFLFSQIGVRKVEQDFQPAEGGGIFYMLPKAGFHFEVLVRQTIKVPGPYAEYAAEYLGLENVITSGQVSYELLEIRLKTFTTQDPDQLFYIVYDEKQSKDERDIQLMFSGSGLFLGTDGYPTEEMSSSYQLQKHKIPDEDSLNRMFRFLAKENTYIKIDTIVKRISIDTLTIEDVSYKRSNAFITDEQKASEAAEAIMGLRKNQHNLLTGYQEVAYSEGTIRFMYGELKKMENEYLDMFRGKVIHKESTHYSTFVPESDGLDTWTPVFRFSQDKGFEQIDEGNEQPVFIKFEPSDELFALESALQQSANSVDESRNGFFTRIPLMTDISLRIRNDSYYIMKALVPQFGEVMNIPKSYFNVSLYPETGALKSATLKF